MALREYWWSLQKNLERWGRMRGPENSQYRAVVRQDLLRWASGSVKPIQGGTSDAIHAAVEWLINAQDATPDDGISLGYFPGDCETRWRPSYPETTGYIAPSLLRYADRYGKPKIKDRALAAMRWEAEVQMESGAVQGGWLRAKSEQQAAVFNTGMVLQGWTAAWRASKEDVFFSAGSKAAEFLYNDLNVEGHYRTHGPFVAADKIKAYNVLCSWALLRFAQDSGNDDYKDAAIRNVEATLKLQNSRGWLSNNCLTHPETPLTHTIGYSLQGILEIGVLLDREDFIDAVRRSAEEIIPHIRENGFLAGKLDSNWKPVGRQSCLTGSAQIAIVLFRLADILGNPGYGEKAILLVDFLKALQQRTSGDPGINGAIAGSFPIVGGYMSYGYPNWATKYFLDALMLQKAHD